MCLFNYFDLILKDLSNTFQYHIINNILSLNQINKINKYGYCYFDDNRDI